MTLRFARELIVHEDLGSDDSPDLLWVGASAADPIGHRYGPRSREVQDYYLRLDRMLDDLLSLLDDRVGRGRYVVALTSDHGIPVLPEERARRGADAGRIDSRQLMLNIDAVMQHASSSVGMEETVSYGYMTGLFIDPRPVPPERMKELRGTVAGLLRGRVHIADAFTFDELASPDTPQRPFLDMYRRSFHPDRSADVQLLFEANYLLRDPMSPPVNHGSPYPYDTHVPLLLFGPGVTAGRYDDRADPLDLAPTLARMLGIAAPDDLDGRVLERALR
jgi:predicted AlkP superfamily pyrophosphatase or phosphodiesterase